MAVRSSGSISLSEIQTEFGGSNPISLSEYYRGGGYISTPPSWNGNVPASGAISIGQFYGTAKYYTGSATWNGAANTTWTAPAWVESVKVSGTAGGGGGGHLYDEGCIHDMGGSGGGSSGEMCSNYTLAVSPGTTYTIKVGAGAGQDATGANTVVGSFTLRGGRPGGGSGGCSYFDNGHYNAPGTVLTTTGTYGYNGGNPGRGSRITGYDEYGQAQYGYFWAGGYGGNGWGNTGGGARGEAGPGASRAWNGGAATAYGGGGGGAAINFGSASGGAGYAGFLTLTW